MLLTSSNSSLELGTQWESFKKTYERATAQLSGMIEEHAEEWKILKEEEKQSEEEATGKEML